MLLAPRLALAGLLAAQALHLQNVHANTQAHVSSPASKSQRCRRAARQRPPSCEAIRTRCADYGSGLAGYVELYYCARPSRQPAMLLGMALWLGVLFVWLGVSASEYFSPNISTLAALLGLPESLAGVSLLALGNGAPDLFSTFSAVRAGSAALAIGQLVGSASFIVGIVAGATTLIVPTYKVGRLSYLRELSFFTATAAIVSAIVLTEKLTRTLALCMVGLYTAYVLTVMLTTYYEQQRRDLGLATEDDWLAAMHPQHPVPDLGLDLDMDPDAYAPERPLIARFHSRSYGALPLVGAADAASRGHGGVVGNSSTSALSAIGAVRRQTINIPHSWLGHGTGPSASGDVLGAGLIAANNASIRALGGLLHQHRKSMLTAAECQDILSEIHDSSGHSGDIAAADIAGRDLSTTPSKASAGLQTRTCDASALAQQQPPASAAAPWGSYRMRSPSCHSARSLASRTHLSIDQDAGDQTSDSASNFLQITPTSPLAARPAPSFFPAAAASCHATPSLTTPTPTPRHSARRPEYLSPASCSRSRRALSPASSRLPSSGDRPQQQMVSQQDATSMRRKSPLPATSAAMSSTQASAHAGSSTSLTPHARGRAPNSASIVDLLAALPVSGSPMSTHDPRHAPSDDIGGSGATRNDGFWERAWLLARACIPTLRYWRRDASKPLKLFIAVSAVPVLMLTLTVPVVKEIPSAGNDQHPHSPDRHADGDPDSNSAFLVDAQRSPSVARSLSMRSQQTDSIDLALQGRHKSPLLGSHSTAERAVRMTSYFRSAISVPFLFAALKISGYQIHAASPLAQAAGICAISALSLACNYIARHSARPPYWLQMAPCFVGFVCGLAWVYIVADEIVSITQALGVILNLNEEIMGLTVVGFGNSLGDLVTNLTLTRMGFPMMAISACFGGPMLCLLLGVGVAAFASLASGEISSGAYRIPLTSPTVLVSTACLLFNSALFLLVVPRQKYYMTRAVGLMAMVVYLVGMVVNVYLVV
ncbi:hypothetical protein GGF40_001158 [Coemansia sp. RSA 1286]|nr:hypothetical protein GGF40_001158 [Coemansia sp. RSA 1286]